MIEAGLPANRANHHDPRLIEAAGACTPEELAALVRERPGKPLAWYCNTALGRRRDVAEQGRAPPGAPLPAPPMDPIAKWRREREHELENREYLIRHQRDVLGTLSAEDAETRIAEAREQFRELIDRGPEDLAA